MGASENNSNFNEADALSKSENEQARESERPPPERQSKFDP